MIAECTDATMLRVWLAEELASPKSRDGVAGIIRRRIDAIMEGAA